MRIITILSSLLGSVWSPALANQTPLGLSTYTNPVLDAVGADPFVIQHDGYYLMTYTTGTNITLLKSNSLTDCNNAEAKLVFDPPQGMPYSTDIWAPELHHFDGRWYFIFTADPAYDNPPPLLTMYCDFDCPALHHRMFVLESTGSHPWTSNYTFKAELDTYDQFAIDGTYFVHSTGLYHAYSCWQRQFDGWPANLCITRMSNPWTVSSPLEERTILSVPSEPWEKTPYGSQSVRLASNEGPQQLVNPKTKQTFIIYSAARSDNPNYCLGQLELVGPDPMNAADWVKHDGCVFWQDKQAGAVGVGHGNFVKSPDGTEDWVVYHGMRDGWDGWKGRTIRAQKFDWNDDGSPRFPRPGYGPYKAPSGQK